MRIDRFEKRNIYVREGVHYLWLVDPRARTLETFELVAGRWADSGTFVDDAPVRAVPFDAIEFNLGVLWADAAPAPIEP